MPFGFSDTIIVQAPKPADAKTYVALGQYYESKDNILSSHKYIGMEVIEYLDGVYTKYVWTGSVWQNLGTPVFSTSDNTTTAVGNIPVGTSLNNMTWHDILNMMLYVSSISTLTLKFTNQYLTEYKVSYGTSILNNSTCLFSATLQIPTGFDFNTKEFRLVKTYGTTTTLAISNWSLAGNIATGNIDLNLGTSRPYNGSIELRILKTGTTTYYSKVLSIRYLPPIYYFKLDAETLSSSNYLNQSGQISKTLLDAQLPSTVQRKELQTSTPGTYSFASGAGYLYFLIPVLTWEGTTNKYAYTSMKDQATNFNLGVNTAEDKTMMFDNEGSNTTTLPYKLIRSENNLTGAITIIIA